MIPDSPTPREELEARLTALLLGELPADEAAALRQAIAQDAELAKLYARLERTIDLVRETAATPAEQSADQPVPLKLSDGRREKLLARFKTIAPKEFTKPRRREVSWVLQIAAVAAVVGILAAISVPTLSSMKSSTKFMRQIDVADNGPAVAHELGSLNETVHYAKAADISQGLNKLGRDEKKPAPPAVAFKTWSLDNGSAIPGTAPPRPTLSPIALPSASEVAETPKSHEFVEVRRKQVFESDGASTIAPSKQAANNIVLPTGGEVAGVPTTTLSAQASTEGRLKEVALQARGETSPDGEVLRRRYGLEGNAPAAPSAAPSETPPAKHGFALLGPMQNSTDDFSVQTPAPGQKAASADRFYRLAEAPAKSDGKVPELVLSGNSGPGPKLDEAAVTTTSGRSVTLDFDSGSWSQSISGVPSARTPMAGGTAGNAAGPAEAGKSSLYAGLTGDDVDGLRALTRESGAVPQRALVAQAAPITPPASVSVGAPEPIGILESPTEAEKPASKNRFVGRSDYTAPGGIAAGDVVDLFYDGRRKLSESEAAEKFVPLEIKLPQPAFKGTPMDMPSSPSQPTAGGTFTLAPSTESPPAIDPATGLPAAPAAPSAEPEVTIKARFADVAQNEPNALGYNWYLGDNVEGKANGTSQAGTLFWSDQTPSPTAGAATAPPIGVTRKMEFARKPGETAGRGELADSSRGNVGLGLEGDFGRFKPDVIAPDGVVVATPPSAAPMLGDLPIAGRLFRSEGRAAETPVGSTTTVNGPAPQGTVAGKPTQALGFDWYLGNTLMDNNSVVVQGGTAPSYSGNSATVNPSGTFPGTRNPASTPSDSLPTSGLRDLDGDGRAKESADKTGTGFLALNGGNTFGGQASAQNYVNDGTITIQSGGAATPASSTVNGLADTSGQWNFSTGTPNVGALGVQPKTSAANTENADLHNLQSGLEPMFQSNSRGGSELASRSSSPGPQPADRMGSAGNVQALSKRTEPERQKAETARSPLALPAVVTQERIAGEATFSIDQAARKVVVLADDDTTKKIKETVGSLEQTKTPSKARLETPSELADNRAKAATAVRDAAVLFEMKKLDESAAKLKEANKLDPANQQAYYYNNLIQESRYLETQNKRDVSSRHSLAEVEEAWFTPPKRQALSVPNSNARSTNFVANRGRDNIARKLDLIHLGAANYAGLPLSEVVNSLYDEAKKRDPDKGGLNFIISPNLYSGSGTNATPLPLDPATGLPAAPAAVASGMDLGAVHVKLDKPLTDMRLTDALDAIVKAADRPIKYSIVDYGVVFSSANPVSEPRKESEPPKQSRPPAPAAEPQPEVQTCDNAFSTFSLNISDVSFKLAMASLEKGQMPDVASVRSEEFINAFDYRDPEPPPGAPIGFAWERARYPFSQNRDLLRFSLKTAALGRQAGRPLNIVLLLDNSGSMERADRVQIIREALRVLAGHLQAKDKLSVVTFARTARLVADGVSGSEAGKVVEEVGGLTPQGGTNLEDAMNTAYETALRHYLADGINRVVLLTDGAANLGNVEPDALKQKVEAHRKQGVALDCFGIGWEGYNDDLLEVLSRNGDGRYGFINSPEEAATEFAGQLAGALHVAASDVKVQVEFNPKRVTAYRQIGYAKHQLKKEQFRDNTVDAAEIAAQEAGNALYVIEVNPRGEGPLGTVRVRYKVPNTAEYHEHEWEAPYAGNAVALEQASPAMRLAASASAFSEWLVSSPYAAEVTPDGLLGYLSGVPEVYGVDGRPKKLEWMIRQAKSVVGK